MNNSPQDVTNNIKLMYMQKALYTITLWPNQWFKVA